MVKLKLIAMFSNKFTALNTKKEKVSKNYRFVFFNLNVKIRLPSNDCVLNVG